MHALWEILVPLVKPNSSVRFSKSHHEKWYALVRSITGGLTVFAPVYGQWLSPEGNIVKEVLVPIRISCTFGDINKVSDLVASHYNQTAVMFYKLTDDVRIKMY